jgi:short-subunit dehydrogenase
MKIITVNQTSAITSIQKLLPNLKRGENAKIILIGSTAGLDNAGNSQVSYVSSKFGIRGVGSAIREHVRKYGIGVTVINPGEIAETHLNKGQKKRFPNFKVSESLLTISFIWRNA